MALNNGFTLIQLFLSYLYLPEMFLRLLNGLKLTLLEIMEHNPSNHSDYYRPASALKAFCILPTAFKQY